MKIKFGILQHIKSIFFFCLLFIVLLPSFYFFLDVPYVSAQTGRPNVMVIQLDDADEASLNQLLAANKLPNIKQYIVDKSIRFTNSFVTESTCCPSRATLLTGMYSHNTGTYNVTGTETGLQGLVNSGLAQVTNGAITSIDWMPSWLQANNYYTGHIGKFMNTASYGGTTKPGFNFWRHIFGYDARPGMYFVYKDADPNAINPDMHEVKYINEKTKEFIDLFVGSSGKPNFYVQISPSVPHVAIPSWGEETSSGLSADLASHEIVGYNVFDPPDATIAQRRQVIIPAANGDYDIWYRDLVSGNWGNWTYNGLASALLPGTGNLPIVAFNAFKHPDIDGIRQHVIRGDLSSGYTVYHRDIIGSTVGDFMIDGTSDSLFPGTGTLPIVGFAITNLEDAAIAGGDMVHYLLRGDPTNGYHLYHRARIDGVWTTFIEEALAWDMLTGNFPIESFDAFYIGQGKLQLQIIRQKAAGVRTIYKQDIRSFYAPVAQVLGDSTTTLDQANSFFVYGTEEEQLSLPSSVTDVNAAYPQTMWGGRVYADGNWFGANVPNNPQTFAAADYPGGVLPAGTLRTDGPDGFSAISGFDLPGISKSNFNNCSGNLAWICAHWPELSSPVIGGKTQQDFTRRAHLDRQESMLSVDVLVGKIIDYLQQKNVLANTMIILTSDNGYFQGEHRLGNKMFPYEESIHVPLYIRPPNATITTGINNSNTVVNIDVVPTILDFAGLWNSTYQAKIDGRSLKPILDNKTTLTSNWRKWFLLDYHFPRGNVNFNGWEWAWGIPDFKGLRIGTEAATSDGPNHLFAMYTDDPLITGEPVEYELYDMNSDPDQISNRVADPAYAIKKTFYSNIIARLGACHGDNCRKYDMSLAGDVNTDYKVDAADIKAVLTNFLSGLFDLNGDGKANSWDIGFIISHFLP